MTKNEIIAILRSMPICHSRAEDIAPSIINADEVADAILATCPSPAPAAVEALKQAIERMEMARRWRDEGKGLPMMQAAIDMCYAALEGASAPRNEGGGGAS